MNEGPFTLPPYWLRQLVQAAEGVTPDTVSRDAPQCQTDLFPNQIRVKERLGLSYFAILDS